MRNLTRHPALILALILAIIIVIASMCRNDEVEPTVVKEYIHDTTTVEIITEVPKPYKIVQIDTIYVPYAINTTDTIRIMPTIDTLAILSDYFNVIEYKDTISDSSLDFYLTESISQNRIIKRGTSYKWKRPVIVVNENPKRNYLYGGLMFYQKLPTNTSSIGLMLNYSNQKLTASVGVDPINKCYYVGAGVKFLSW